MMIATPSFKLAAHMAGNARAERLALVLPGFLDTKDHTHMQGHVDHLASLGYLAVSFDPPGTWDSEGDIAGYTMTNYLAAIRELVDHFDGRPTFVVGTSRGGTMAMLSAIRVSEIFAVAAIMSKVSYGPGSETIHPLSEWKKAGSRHYSVTIPGRPGHKREFDVPYSVMEDTRQYDLRAELATLAKPKLFVAGLKDTTVQPEVVRAGFDLAAEPKRLVIVDSDHLYRRHPEIVAEINDALSKFLADYCAEVGR